MKHHLPTLTIGISACNEAENLSYLIPNLLAQHHRNYLLEKIIIMSDGSTDSTHTLAKSFTEKSVVFVLGNSRQGKPKRVNQIFKKCQSDIVAIIDADVKLKNRSIIDHLVSPLSKNIPGMTSGVAMPFPPRTMVERLAYAGVLIWHKTKKLIPNDSMYDSEGMIRAFSKKAYTSIRFPQTSSEDTYPYLFGKTHNWQFTCQRKAIVWYRLPATIKEYRSQQRRYLTSMKIEETQFSKEVLEKELLITSKHKLIGLWQACKENPIFSLLYCAWSVYIRLDLLVMRESFSSKWQILTSTKKINI